jgi:hypothetical protein
MLDRDRGDAKLFQPGEKAFPVGGHVSGSSVFLARVDIRTMIN